jgi:hypothetical protein
MATDGSPAGPRPLPAAPVLTDADALRAADRPAVALAEEDTPPAAATPLDVADVLAPPPTAEADVPPVPAAEAVPAAETDVAEAAEPVTEAAARPVEAAPLDQVRQRLAALDVDGRSGRGEEEARPAGTGRTRRPRRSPRWIGPLEDGSCRDTHPVKVKLRSGLFHLPGMLVYDRTRADRCYRSAEDAVADGFEQAKR